MDGMELCRRLKNDIRTSHVPVILLMAKAAVEDKLAGLETGADAYLSKPFDPDELLAHLDNVLRVRQLLRAHLRQNAILEPELEPIARPENAFLTQLRQSRESLRPLPGFEEPPEQGHPFSETSNHRAAPGKVRQ